MSLHTKLIVTAFAVFIIAGAMASLVRAEPPKIQEYEKAIFAYFKLAGKPPDYQKWIDASPEYQDMAADQDAGKIKKQYFRQEDLRLKWGFGTYDPASEFLKIKADIVLMLKATPKGDKLNFKFFNSAQQEIPYFPYPYGNEWIALVVNDLGNYTSVSLTPEQSKNARQYFEPGKLYRASMKLRVRPVSVDTEKPIKIDNNDHWLMLGETAYMGFQFTSEDTGKPVLLWEYIAPWYLNDTERSLLNLIKP